MYDRGGCRRQAERPRPDVYLVLASQVGTKTCCVNNKEPGAKAPGHRCGQRARSTGRGQPRAHAVHRESPALSRAATDRGRAAQRQTEAERRSDNGSGSFRQASPNRAARRKRSSSDCPPRRGPRGGPARCTFSNPKSSTRTPRSEAATRNAESVRRRTRRGPADAGARAPRAGASRCRRPTPPREPAALPRRRSRGVGAHRAHRRGGRWQRPVSRAAAGSRMLASAPVSYRAAGSRKLAPAPTSRAAAGSRMPTPAGPLGDVETRGDRAPCR